MNLNFRVLIPAFLWRVFNHDTEIRVKNEGVPSTKLEEDPPISFAIDLLLLRRMGKYNSRKGLPVLTDVDLTEIFPLQERK